MDAASGVARAEVASLREQIHYTQAELGHKIDSLEHEVRSVAGLAKEHLQDVVDVRRHIGRHPLAACMVAVTAGVFLGFRGRRSLSMEEQSAPQSSTPWPLRLLAPELSMIRTLLVGKALSVAGEWLSSVREQCQTPSKR